MLLAVIVGIIAVSNAGPLGNDDTYFHLRFGSEFLSGAWSLNDPGSVSSSATNAWLPTQWLPQVAMAWLERELGLWAVAFLFLALILGHVALLWTLCRRHAGPVLCAVIVGGVVLASAGHLSARPQVISYALTAWFTAAWLASARDRRPRVHLIPLTWVWAMCHGMWPIAIVIGLVALVAIALECRDRSAVLRLAVVPLGGAVAAGLTPLGPSLYGAVLAVGGRSEFFAEWGPTEFTTVSPAIAAFGLAVLLGTLALRRDRAGLPVTLLSLLALAWALYSARTVPVAAAMAGPLLALVLPTRRPSPASAESPPGELPRPALPEPRGPGRVETTATAVVVLTALVVGALLCHRDADVPDDDLAWSDATLDALGAGTVILNEWAKGGYTMWRHPHLDPVMHGYGETFTIEELQANSDLLDLEPGWEEQLAGTGARWALLEADTPLAHAIEGLGWEVVGTGGGEDDVEFVLLSAPSAA